MERPRPSTLAMATLGVGITAYELLCADGETLSEWLDPHMDKPLRRAAIGGAMAVTVLHLANCFETLGLERLDPFENGLSKIRQAYKVRGK